MTEPERRLAATIKMAARRGTPISALAEKCMWNEFYKMQERRESRLPASIGR